MTDNLTLKFKLTDGKGFTGQIKVAEQYLKRLGASASQSFSGYTVGYTDV